MTLADDATENPVILAMPASLPEWTTMSAMNRPATMNQEAINPELDTKLLPSKAGLCAY